MANMAAYVASCKNIIRNIAAASSRIRHFSVNRCVFQSQTQLGFVGLGNMGGPMAQNLLRKGHKLIAYDVHQEALDTIKDAGASVASSPKDIANKSTQIITMLPNNSIVQDVYLGDNGLFAAIKPGTMLIDSSTVAPNVSKEIARKAEKKGALFLDAPVSGGVNAAIGATLTFMVGGREEQYQLIRPLLLDMGKNVVHCGPVGAGQAAKICNNMLLAISMIGTAETMNLGIRLGLEPKLLAKVLNTSSGRCWSSELYNPVPGVLDGVPSSNDYQGGFGTALMTKDLGLAQDAATHTLTPIPLGGLAHQLYRMMMATGYSSKDFSSVFKFLQEETNK